MRSKTLFQSVLFIAVVCGIFFGVTNFQNISDWLRLKNYQPPARISAIADETTMNDSTRRLFYINHPQLSDKASFNGQCRVLEQTIVLGCFVENKGIFLLDVEDKRLNGVVEVTAAHETLHAAYERLSDNERAKVDKMTSDFFATLDNQRIKEVIEGYRQKDPSVVPNELHSILGTEVRDLPSDLERYYEKYFNNRKAIVSMSERYEQTFISLRNQISNYDQQLNQLKAQIDKDQEAIVALGQELDLKRSELDALRASGDTDSYNQQVPIYNQRVESYNSLINETKQLINSYNTLVEKRNNVATVEQELVEQIDSSKLTEKKR